MPSSTIFRLIVDTNSYSGNFERQSIAYATGQVGDCGVGQEEAVKAKEALAPEVLEWWEDHRVDKKAENYDCHRPAAIHPTPGFFNNGWGGHFPTTEQGRIDGLAHYKQAVQKHSQDQIDRLAYVTLGQGGWTEEAVARERKAREKNIADSVALTKVPEHPAYQSVAIMVDEEPPAHIVASFEARMTEYLTAKNITVLGTAIETEEVVRKVSRKPMR